MRLRDPIGALALAATLLTACGASSDARAPGSPPAPRDCRGLGFPYPAADATLMPRDSGKTVHVPLGGLVEVDLLGSPTRRWSPIAETGTAVVSLSTQAMTPTVGTRLGEYCAIHKGSDSLSATDGTVQWSATIKVP